MDLASIGATPLGGVRRITLTDADRQGRDRVVEWLKAAGLEVRIDPIGNIFGRRPGRDPCKDGIIHNEIEDAKPAHLAAGCNCCTRCSRA